MVGNGETRIFSQCYFKCCKLQNLTPLNIVIPTGNGKKLDFCVDRIKYQEWAPILNALCWDLSLHSVSIRCRQQVKTVLEHIDCERLAKTVNKRPVILTYFMLTNLIAAISQLISNSTLLNTLLLEGLPLKIPYLNPLRESASLYIHPLNAWYEAFLIWGHGSAPAKSSAKQTLPYHPLLEPFRRIFRLLFENLWIRPERRNFRHPALINNTALQHLHLPRCLIGDAGCMAICKAVQRMPNLLTLDLSGCDLTATGATYIAELLKAQKLHRYSESWVHTLRYRLPELDNMSGLRRITLCGNTQLGDTGVCTLIDTLRDDLWIKALDVQNCGLTEHSAARAMEMLDTNNTLVILDMRHNPDISSEWLSKIRARLRQNERGIEMFSWLTPSSNLITTDGRSIKSGISRNAISKDRYAQNKTAGGKASSTRVVKKEKDYLERLEEQLQEEILHRQQLEELNVQLVEQMKQLKQQQIRIWNNTPHGLRAPNDSFSDRSAQISCGSSEFSSSSACSSSVAIDQSTLSYIQQAFKDIYCFIKNNQCTGQCIESRETDPEPPAEERGTPPAPAAEVHITPKKAQSSHANKLDVKVNMNSKSAHILGDSQLMDMKPEMIERQMGDSKNAHVEEQIIYEELISANIDTYKKSYHYETSSCSSTVTSSSDTLVCSEQTVVPSLNPRDAFYSSSDDDSS